MKRNLRYFIFGVIVLLITGCTAKNSVLKQMPPRPMGDVEVLLDAPQNPHEIIGMIEPGDSGDTWIAQIPIIGLLAYAGVGKKSFETIKEDMQREGGKMGANAVIAYKQDDKWKGKAMIWIK